MDFTSLKAVSLADAVAGIRFATIDASGNIKVLDPPVYTSLTSVASASTSKSTLKNLALNAGVLLATGLKGLRISAWGTCKATANAKTQTVDFGGTTVASTGAVANNNGSWVIEAVVMRSAANAQAAMGWSQSAATAVVSATALTVTDTASILIEITATNVTDADGTTCTGLLVEPIF